MKLWKDWGRRPPKRVVAHPVLARGETISEIVVHHSVTAEGPFLGVVRSIQAAHLDNPDEGYFDIAYNYLVSSEGPDVAVGRGSAQGGATGKGVDARSLSVCFVGDFSERGLNAQAKDNFANLVSFLRGAGILSDGFVVVNGHKHYRATECPGRIADEVKELERLAAPAGRGGAGGGVVAEPDDGLGVPDVQDAVRAVSAALKSCAAALSMLARSLDDGR